MTGGRMAALAALLALGGCAAPDAPPPPGATPGSAPPEARFRPAQGEPFRTAIAVRPAAATEPAPVPNREIEAPPDRLADARTPSLEPMLLPSEQRQGVTFGREHLRDTGPERSAEGLMPGVRIPFDNLVPGARLRIPIE